MNRNYTINVNEGGQVIIPSDNSTVYSVQKNIGNSSKENSAASDVKFMNCKKKSYFECWNGKLFLELDDDRALVTLSKVFVWPDYKIITNGTIECYHDDILEDIIEKFVGYKKASTMLIKGNPGMGKSSIVSWIANQYYKNNKVFILRFGDWEREELEDGLLKAICNTLKCKKSDLNKCVLVLDGFDELKVPEKRNRLLEHFFGDILDLENTKFLITSRSTYIKSKKFDNVIELAPFGVYEVAMFYRKLTGINLEKEKIKSKDLSVLGIPVILYMAIKTGIDLTGNISKPELYQRIFAEENGIFSRFSYEGGTYSRGSNIFSYNENVKEYINFLKETAFAIFEKNDNFLDIEECKIPKLKFHGEYINILDFPIKYLFEKTKSRLEFVHKSIYEYFMAQYVFDVILKYMNNSDKKLAFILGRILKSNRLSCEILEFLKYRIKNSDVYSKMDMIYNAFQLMLQNGMTYYAEERYKKVIECEMNVFANMLELIHLRENQSYLFEFSDYLYLRYNHQIGLNLQYTNLEGAELDGVNLIEVNLEKARLVTANLDYSNLGRANLKDANMTGAYLEGANLQFAILTNADLTRAYLEGANLEGARLHQCILSGAVLNGANLQNADLIKADLEEVNLEDAVLEGTVFDELQVPYLIDKHYNLEKCYIYIYETKKTVIYDEYRYWLFEKKEKQSSI